VGDVSWNASLRPQEVTQLPEGAHHPKSCRSLGAAECGGNLLVGKLRDDPKPECLALRGRQGVERRFQLVEPLPGPDPLLDRLEVLLVRANRHPEPSSSYLLDPTSLVVVPKEVLGDSVEPRPGRAIRLVPEPAQAERDLGKELGSELGGSGFRKPSTKPAVELSPVAQVELSERLGVCSDESDLTKVYGVEGHVSAASATTLELVYDDGAVESIPIQPNGDYAYAVPAERTDDFMRPQTLVARNAAGEPVASVFVAAVAYWRSMG
jgi:hypothetical protein